MDPRRDDSGAFGTWRKGALRQLRGDRACAQGVARTLATAVGPRARAVLVTGSFGRGEGAFVAAPGGRFVPHNDVDLVLVTDGGAKAARRAVAELSHAASQRLGWEVEAWTLDAVDLVDPPRTLFWLDVALGGHEVVWGSTRGPRCPPAERASSSPTKTTASTCPMHGAWRTQLRAACAIRRSRSDRSATPG
jgi:hypothetical protein